MLLPLHLMQNFIFCPKYVISNSYISPNNLRSILISVLGLFALLTVHVYLCYLSLSDMFIYSEISQLSMFVFELLFYVVGIVINTVAAIVQTKDNVNFVITIQEVVNMFKFNYIKYTIYNWMYVIVIAVYYIVYSTCGILIFEGSVSYFYGIPLLLCFDLNIIYIICSVNLLQRTLIIWNNVIYSGGNRDRPAGCAESYFRLMMEYWSATISVNVPLVFWLISVFLSVDSE